MQYYALEIFGKEGLFQGITREFCNFVLKVINSEDSFL